MNSTIAPFSFILPTEIRYGEGVVSGLPDELTIKNIGSVLVISDSGIMEQPFAAVILDELARAGIKSAVFDRVEPNPKDRNVTEAVKKAAEMHAEAIVALGGGSPIDCAKAVSVVAALGGKVRDYEDPSRINRPVLPLYTVPTTAGTGSEVTFGSVITDTTEHFKFTIKSPNIAPRVAFIDPLYTHSKPPKLTAATGLDALTHAVEAYTSKAANPLSNACALYAVQLINRHLITAVEQPGNSGARAGMMTGSLLAGIAFSHSDVASVHCIAEAMGGRYDTPHGICNAVALPVVMEYNLDFAEGRYAEIASAMGFQFASFREGAELAVARVKELVRETGLPDFSSFEAKEADFQELAEKAERNGSNKDNPRPMTAEDYMEILRRLVKI
jgi:alcohol dehydrogenase